MLRNIKIVLPADPTCARIELDGAPLDGVTKIEFSASAAAVTTVKLTMRAFVELDGVIRESEIVHVERSRRCPHHWGEHSKQCLLDEGHATDHVFPLTAQDVADAKC